jgi:hypothetical protein
VKRVTRRELREAIGWQRFIEDPSATQDARHQNRIVMRALNRWLGELLRRKRKRKEGA